MKTCPTLEFKKDFKEVVNRHIQLQKSKKGCLICAGLKEDELIASEVQIPPLENVDFEKEPLLLPRLFCDRAEEVFSVTKEYPDDSIPYVAPRYGTGIIGGMILGDMRLGADTSWIQPVGSSLEECLDFQWGQENKWIDIVIKGFNYATHRMRGKCYVFLEGYHTPLEFASLVRGSEIYFELYTRPKDVHKLLQKCDDALMWLYKLLEQRIKNESYGICAHSLWMERGLPFLSDDSAGNISPEQYREFGMPYTDRMFSRYGGGFLHFHTQAYHQMDNLSKMNWMTIYNWRQDPNTSMPYEILDKILSGAKEKIVMIYLEPEQIREKIELLSQGKFLIRTTCEDRREQMEIIELVKRKAPIL